MASSKGLAASSTSKALLAALLLALVVPGSARAEETAATPFDRYSQQAQTAYDRGKFVLAEKTWRRALAIAKRGGDDAKTVAAMIGVGKSLVKESKYPLAQEMFQQALDLDKEKGLDPAAVNAEVSELSAVYKPIDWSMARADVSKFLNDIGIQSAYGTRTAAASSASGGISSGGVGNSGSSGTTGSGAIASSTAGSGAITSSTAGSGAITSSTTGSGAIASSTTGSGAITSTAGSGAITSSTTGSGAIASSTTSSDGTTGGTTAGPITHVRANLSKKWQKSTDDLYKEYGPPSRQASEGGANGAGGTNGTTGVANGSGGRTNGTASGATTALVGPAENPVKSIRLDKVVEFDIVRDNGKYRVMNIKGISANVGLWVKIADIALDVDEQNNPYAQVRAGTMGISRTEKVKMPLDAYQQLKDGVDQVDPFVALAVKSSSNAGANSAGMNQTNGSTVAPVSPVPSP